MSSYILNYITENFFSLFFDIESSIKSNFIESGTLEVSNLVLRSDFFYIISIPYIKLINSYIGKISFHYSKKSKNKKIIASIEHIFIHIRKKNFEEINKKEEIKYMEERKIKKLNNQEKFSLHNNDEKKSDLWIIQYIIENIELKISNVVIKFDDSVSFPKIPCCFGIILENINILSKNDFIKSREFNENSNSEIYETIEYKLIEIKNFSLYFDCYGKPKYLDYDKLICRKSLKKINRDMTKMPRDSHEFIAFCLSEILYNSDNFNSHQFILFKLYLDIKLEVNILDDKIYPKFISEVNMPQIMLNISITQIHLILKFFEHIRIIKSYQNGILKDYYNKELSESEKKSYIKYYNEYYKNKYIKNLKNIELPEIIKEMDKRSSYENILILRLISQKQAYVMNNLEEIEEKIKKEEGRWFGKNQELINNLNNEKKEIVTKLNQIKYLLTENKEKIKEQEDNNELNDYPNDYIWLKEVFFILIVSGSIYETIKRGDRGGWEYHNKIIDIAIQQLNMINIFKKEGYIFNVSVQNIVVTEEEIKNKNYNKILFGNLISQDILLDLKYEVNHNLPFYNQKLSLYFNRSLYIIFNIYSFNNIKNYIIDMILPALNSIEIISSISDDIIYQNLQLYNQSLFLSQNHISLDISFKDLYIIFPLNICDINNTKCILINVEQITIKSLLEKKDNSLVDSKNLKINEKEKRKEIIYENYYFEIKKMKISFVDNCVEYNNYENNSKKFLENFNLKGDLKILNNINGEQINLLENIKLKINIDKFNYWLKNDEKILIGNYLEEINNEIKKDEVRIENEENEEENLYYNEENEGNLYNEENYGNNIVDNIEEVITEEEEDKTEENINNNYNYNMNNKVRYSSQEDKDITEEIENEDNEDKKESEIEENIENLHVDFTEDYPEKNDIDNTENMNEGLSNE